jgi:Lytic polysaccharide mono-oxygenase, cellulose-degrading
MSLGIDDGPLEPARPEDYREAVPPPPSAHRTLAAAALVAACLLITALIGQPARAHGAMASPVSRAMACGAEGGAAATSAACRAARAVSGAVAFDNVRVANVGGRDRQRIPDGRLCSGGLSRFKGLDLARADWPATTVTAGAIFTFRYRVTIPHSGSFRLYVTRAGYLPTRPLRWSDLESKPFLTVNNPKAQAGDYVLRGRLPSAPSGRQLIYTIWQTTSTPDTYYSCSDVVFTERLGGVGVGGSVPASGTPGGASADPAAAVARPAAAVRHPSVALPVAGAVGAGFAGAVAILAVRYRRIAAARRVAARARSRVTPPRRPI